VFTARYGLIPYIKQIPFRLLKVNVYRGSFPGVMARATDPGCSAVLWRRPAVWIAGSNPARETWMFFLCECCVLSGGGLLCDGPIPNPEES
jgi:hypothetical protein